MKTIIIYGLRRSGNHFLISSILQQFSNYVHINDIKLSFDKYIIYKNIKKNKERIDSKWTGFKNVECVLMSVENSIIDNTELDYFRKIDNCYFIILLRCPYSHFSSVWNVYNKNENRLLEIIELWKIYVNYFINNNDYDVIKVLYDEFTSNEKYRINMIKKLGIDNINIDVNKYINYQNSSFQDSSNSKQLYKTMENCVFKDDEKFLKLIKDKNIYNLWNKLLQIENLHFEH